MYISTYNTYIDSTKPYEKPSQKASVQTKSSFFEQLSSKTFDSYYSAKSFPVDYVNKESTFYNKLRFSNQDDSNQEVSKSLDASLHVSSLEIFKKRADSYSQGSQALALPIKKISVPLDSSNNIKFNAQKSAALKVYQNNDAYFYKRAA